MPKGHKLVDWAQSGNDTKLLLSIVKTHGIDYDKVAAEFGKFKLSGRCMPSSSILTIEQVRLKMPSLLASTHCARMQVVTSLQKPRP